MLKPTSELLHRLNRGVRSPRIKYAAILLADILRLRHLIVRLDVVNGCNLRCAMCFFSDPDWRQNHMKGRFTDPEIERLAALFFGEALQVHIGCGMEPTMFRNYPWLVELAKRHRVPFVGLTTNGQMLTESALRHMAEAGLDEITISTHGVTRETYETLMTGAGHELHHASLRMLDGVKRKLGTKTPRLRLNYTVCPSNLDELDGFFDAYGGYELASVQLRPIADFGNTVYRDKDMTPHLPRYRAAVARLAAECRARNVALLANQADPTHARPNPAAAVYLDAILRYLNPGVVWRDDFAWRDEDYRSYKRRIGWRRHLLRRAVAGVGGPPPASHQAISDLL